EELQPAQRQSLGEVVRELQELAEIRKRSSQRAKRPAKMLAQEQQAAADLERWLDAVAAPGQQTRLQRIVASFLEEDSLAESFIESSQGNRALPPEPTLRSAARVTEVVGKMLGKLAESYHAPKALQRWPGMVAWFGRIFWGLIEAAVPQGFWNLVVRHWLYLLYGFELFLLVAGTLLGQESVVQFGWTSLGITGGLHLILFLLGSLIVGEGGGMRWLKRVAIAVILALTLFGGYEAYARLQEVWYQHWPKPA